MIQSKGDSDRTPLELLELKHLGWRARYAKDMSDVYVEGEGVAAYLDGRAPDVMVIGEAPGAEEVLRRRPFVGPAGRVLRQLMESADIYTGYTPQLGKGNCWLTNVVKFRPPNNRTPYPQEIQSVRHLLRTEWICIGKPRIIIPVGGTALTALVGRNTSILKHAGWLHTVRSTVDRKDLFIWPMLHPAFGLRNKQIQPVMEKDWIALGEWFCNWPPF